MLLRMVQIFERLGSSLEFKLKVLSVSATKKKEVYSSNLLTRCYSTLPVVCISFPLAFLSLSKRENVKGKRRVILTY